MLAEKRSPISNKPVKKKEKSHEKIKLEEIFFQMLTLGIPVSIHSLINLVLSTKSVTHAANGFKLG